MHTKNVPETLWRSTLDDLSRTYDGALVSLEIVGGDLGAETAVVDQPLRGITQDRDGVTIGFAKAGGIHLQHRVEHPRDLRVVESDEGALMALELEEKQGTSTLVHFRWPMRPEIFDPAVE